MSPPSPHRCEALETGLEHQKAETTRAVLRYTVKGYMAGENADSKHWRERAETAEARCEALEQELGYEVQKKLDAEQRCKKLVADRKQAVSEKCDWQQAAAIHLETITVLSKRCEALTAERELARAAGSRSLAIRLGELLTLQRAKIEALTAERDSWRRVSERLEGEKVEAQTRCQHLEQAVKTAVAVSVDNYYEELMGTKAILRAALASLLPTQDEKMDPRG